MLPVIIKVKENAYESMVMRHRQTDGRHEPEIED
jgi:hypothetical protein